MPETFRVRSTQLLYFSLLSTIIDMPEQVKCRLLLGMCILKWQNMKNTSLKAIHIAWQFIT